jgi:hypothetical protein
VARDSTMHIKQSAIGVENENARALHHNASLSFCLHSGTP